MYNSYILSAIFIDKSICIIGIGQGIALDQMIMIVPEIRDVLILLMCDKMIATMRFDVEFL